RFYKRHRALLQRGTFYRLVSPFAKDGNSAAWMVVSDNRKEAIVGYYQVLSRPNPAFLRLALKGLRDDAEYEVSGFDGTYFGDELMHAGLPLDDWLGLHPVNRGDFHSRLYCIRA